MSTAAFVAETSISGGAISAHDSATIANLFAKEKDVLTQSIVKKDEQLDTLKLKIHHLENDILSLKAEAKQQGKRKTSKSESVDASLIDTVYGFQGKENTNTSITDSNKKKTTTKKKKEPKRSFSTSAFSKANNMSTVYERSATENSLLSNKRSSVTGSDLKSSSVVSSVNGDIQKCVKCADSTSIKELKEISEKFQQIKLRTYVSCREKFAKADQNGDGTVDIEELSTILESAGLFFTASQIQDILDKVDADNNVALDFFEVLQVVSTLEENPNRRADLPKSLKDNQSKVCAVM